MNVVKTGNMHEKMGFIEYKMPYKMAKAYLDGRNDSQKRIHPQKFLVDVVNQEFGLKGQCVKVIQY